MSALCTKSVLLTLTEQQGCFQATQHIANLLSRLFCSGRKLLSVLQVFRLHCGQVMTKKKKKKKLSEALKRCSREEDYPDEDYLVFSQYLHHYTGSSGKFHTSNSGTRVQKSIVQPPPGHTYRNQTLHRKI